MTNAATTPKRLRIDPGIDPDLRNWALHHTVPGGAFLTLGHGMELGLRRILDEYTFIESRCRSKRVPFDADVYWSLRAELLRQSRPNPRAAPRIHGAPTHRRLERVFVSIAETLIQQIQDHTEPDGPFAEANPTAHAVEYGLRVLKEADAGDVVPGAQFPFDGDALWQTYLAARKSR